MTRSMGVGSIFLKAVLVFLVPQCACAVINGSVSIHNGNTYPYIMLSQLPVGSPPRPDNLYSGLMRRVWIAGDYGFQNNSILISNRYENTVAPGDFYQDFENEWVIFEIEDVSSYTGVPTGEGFVRIGFDGTVLKSWHKTAGTFPAYNTGVCPSGNVELIAKSGAAEYLAVRVTDTAANPGWFSAFYVFKFSEDPSGTSSDVRIIFSDTNDNHHSIKASAILRSNGRLLVLSHFWDNSYNFRPAEYTISGDVVSLDKFWDLRKDFNQRWYPYSAFENSLGTVTMAPSTAAGGLTFGWEQVGSTDVFLCDADSRWSPTDFAFFERCTPFGSYGVDEFGGMAHDRANTTIYISMTIGMDIDRGGPYQYYDQDVAIFAADYNTFETKWKVVFGKTTSGNDRMGHMVPSENFLYFVLDGKFVQFPFCEPGYSTGWNMETNEHVYCMPCNAGKRFSAQNFCGPCPVGQYSPRNATQSFFECLECPPGYYADQEGLTDCKTCPAGYFSSAGIENCIECPMGTFSSAPGSAVCNICPSNYYGNITSLKQCYECPGGSVSPTGSSDKKACKCNAGFFGDVANGETCKVCPDQQFATCLSGATSPTYKSGYWAASSDPYNVLECFPSLACPGGTGYDICEVGYTGTGCTSCDTDYYRADGQCHSCKGGNMGFIVVVSILFTVVMVVLPIVVIFFCLYSKMHEHPVMVLVVRTVKRMWGSLGQLARFMQLVSVILNTNLSWPKGYDIILGFASLFNFSVESFGLGCTMSGNETLAAMYYLKLGIPAIIYAAIGCLITTLSVMTAVTKSERLENLNSFVIRTSLMSVSFLYIFLGSTAVGLFGCASNGNGEYLWQHSAEVVCFVSDGVWITMVPGAALGVFLYGVGIPLGWLVMTLFFHKRRNKPQVSRRFAILWKPYDDWAYFWESFNYFYRFMFVVSSILVIIGPLEQMMFLGAISVIYITLFNLFKPLKNPQEDFLEGVIQITLMLTVLVGIFSELKYANQTGVAVFFIAAIAMYPIVILLATLFIVEPLLGGCWYCMCKRRRMESQSAEYLQGSVPSQELSPFSDIPGDGETRKPGISSQNLLPSA